MMNHLGVDSPSCFGTTSGLNLQKLYNSEGVAEHSNV